jgi:hypothetical protein
MPERCLLPAGLPVRGQISGGCSGSGFRSSYWSFQQLQAGGEHVNDARIAARGHLRLREGKPRHPTSRLETIIQKRRLCRAPHKRRFPVIVSTGTLSCDFKVTERAHRRATVRGCREPEDLRLANLWSIAPSSIGLHRRICGRENERVRGTALVT